MARVQQNLLLLVANVLISLGVFIFFTGFFRGPFRTSTDNQLDVSEVHGATRDSAPFDKVVFLMIDALRSDFVFAENSGFTFTQSGRDNALNVACLLITTALNFLPRSLIRSGAAVPFTALAASPTLTLSRIKALTQGTSQSFLDALLNVLHLADARRLEGEDTWLSRLKKEREVEKAMVFYGVDMWTMLYPDIWDRHEIIDSFYLPDFTSVDRNITRHLPDELANDDWKALVLHYVGLDNVAHFGGSAGSYILPKQIEMDNIVRQIYKAIEQKSHLCDTLLILLGDHGMNEKGNHGGDTPSEIASAMVFISPCFKFLSKRLESPIAATKGYEYYSVVNQIEIVPTLAGLLGLSIPVRSVGMFIPELLGLWQSSDDKLQILLKNAEQMMGVFETEYNMNAINILPCASSCEFCPSQESRVVCLWEVVKRGREDRKMSQNKSSEALTLAINDFSKCAQQCLSVPLNNLSFLHLSAGITCMTALMLLLAKGYKLSQAPWDSGVIIFAIVTATHAMTMFRGQLVREEHHYWAGTGEHWFKSACPVILQFLSQCLNPSGDVPYSTVEYVHDLLFDYPILLWALGSMTWVIAVNNISKYLGMGSLASLATSYALGFLAVTSKACSTQAFNPELVDFMPPWLENLMLNLDRNYGLRIFWTGLVACIVCLLVQSSFSHRVSRKVVMTGVIELASFYIRSQTRPKNLALYSIFDLQLKWLLSPGAELTPSEVAVTILLLGQSSFYAGGRDNSLASFDMMNGYNGIDHTNNGFNVLAVSLQTIFSNWLGPVWWSLASLRMLLAWLEAEDGQRVHFSTSMTGSAGSVFNDVVQKSRKLGSRSKPLTNSSSDVGLDGSSLSLINDEPASGTEHKMRHIVPHRRPFFEHLTLHTFFTASSTLAVMLACIWLRNDPVLWTVLAPKYVNLALWAVFHHFMINVILCTGIWCTIVREKAM